MNAFLRDSLYADSLAAVKASPMTTRTSITISIFKPILLFCLPVCVSFFTGKLRSLDFIRCLGIISSFSLLFQYSVDYPEQCRTCPFVPEEAAITNTLNK